MGQVEKIKALYQRHSIKCFPISKMMSFIQLTLFGGKARNGRNDDFINSF